MTSIFMLNLAKNTKFKKVSKYYSENMWGILSRVLGLSWTISKIFNNFLDHVMYNIRIATEGLIRSKRQNLN